LILRIVWSPDADNDLAQIWNYLAREASIGRADDQVRKIETACCVLAEWPLAGRSRDTIIPGLRTIVATPYVIFYRVSDTVQIIRVLDGRRDIDAILASMP
jgi:toxin ParE1/3/4